MPSITQIDRTFGPGPVQVSQHAPSNGMGLCEQVKSAFRWISYTARDLLLVPRLVGEQRDDPDCRFAQTMKSWGKLLTKDNVEVHIKMLEEEFREASVLFIPNGMGNNRSIDGVDPLYVIAGKESKEANDLVLDPPKNRFKESKARTIVYPFVYPAMGVFSFPHFVVNIIDRVDATIVYYDSQGLTSDDPCRQVFEEPFNMHDNIVELAETIFPDRDSQVIENRSQHQFDPVNCGTIGLGVLEKLYEGKSIVEALSHNPVVDCPSAFRKKLCHKYMEKRVPEKMALFDINRSQKSDRNLPPPKDSDLEDFEVL